MKKRENKRQAERRREAARKKVAASIGDFDDDVIFIREVNRRTRGTSPATPSPPGFRQQKQIHKKTLPKPTKPKGQGRRPIPTLADFMPTPPGSESEDWNRDIAREQGMKLWPRPAASYEV